MRNIAVGLAIVLVGCAGLTGEPAESGPQSANAMLSPSERAVMVTATGCGSASKTHGSGVIVGDGLVVTAAHVAIGATDVSVGDDGSQAAVVALDTVNDLALLSIEGLVGAPVEFGTPQGRTDGTLEAPDGPVAVRVERLLRISVDAVRSVDRVDRDGFELAGPLQRGHSGGGVWDTDGRLVGIVFATSMERPLAGFAVASSEVDVLLSATPVVHTCDPTISRLVPDRRTRSTS